MSESVVAQGCDIHHDFFDTVYTKLIGSQWKARIRAFAVPQLDMQINPIATVVPGSGTNAVQAVENELADLRKMMGDHSSEYWKGPMAAKHQARYKELVGAVSKGR